MASRQIPPFHHHHYYYFFYCCTTTTTTTTTNVAQSPPPQIKLILFQDFVHNPHHSIIPVSPKSKPIYIFIHPMKWIYTTIQLQMQSLIIACMEKLRSAKNSMTLDIESCYRKFEVCNVYAVKRALMSSKAVRNWHRGTLTGHYLL